MQLTRFINKFKKPLQKTVAVVLTHVNDNHVKFLVKGFEHDYEIKATQYFKNTEQWDETNIYSFVGTILEGINHSGRLRIDERNLGIIVKDFVRFFPLEEFRRNEQLKHPLKMSFHLPLQAIMMTGYRVNLSVYIESIGEVL